MTRTASRRRVATVTVVTLTLALASMCACSPARTTPAITGTDPVPAINWADGPPDDGDFDSPWTQAFRDHLVAYAAAFNSRTLDSSQRLSSLIGDELQISYSNRNYRDEYMPGPPPVIITGVTENEDMTATIDVCAHPFWEKERNGSVEASMSVAWGQPQHWIVERVDGIHRVVGTTLDVEEDFGRSCSLDGVRYGLFDPNPFDI